MCLLLCSAVHTKTHETCLNSYTSTNYQPLSIFFTKYLAVTPQYRNENAELKQTGSDSTLELPFDPHTTQLTFLIVLCKISVLCFGGKLSVVLVG